MRYALCVLLYHVMLCYVILCNVMLIVLRHVLFCAFLFSGSVLFCVVVYLNSLVVGSFYAVISII